MSLKRLLFSRKQPYSNTVAFGDFASLDETKLGATLVRYGAACSHGAKCEVTGGFSECKAVKTTSSFGHSPQRPGIKTVFYIFNVDYTSILDILA